MTTRETELQRRLARKRALSLAFVHLTRRPNTEVEPAKGSIDYRVRLRPKSKAEVQEFAVAVSSAWASAATPEPSSRSTGGHVYLDQEMPVVEFLFTMERDEAWYRWVAEPLFSRRLKVTKDKAYQRLDDQALQTIFTRVENWYAGRRRREEPEGPIERGASRSLIGEPPGKKRS